MDRLEQAEYKPYLTKLTQLRLSWEGLRGEELIAAAVKEFGARLAMTSSFGSESVVELHMLSKVSPSTKVIFLDTRKLFGETLRYRDLLQERLGLTNIHSIQPDPADEKKLDPKGALWNSNPDLCCHFRKTLPQERALEGIDAIITGRKRFQTLLRRDMPFVDLVEKPKSSENLGGAESPKDFAGLRWTINPLADWDFEQIERYIEKHQLPTHPLVKEGFLSLGCMPCTERSTKENYRSGRWAGRDKEECGIHKESFVDGGGI